jgi:hypothetical protein
LGQTAVDRLLDRVRAFHDELPGSTPTGAVVQGTKRLDAW